MFGKVKAMKHIVNMVLIDWQTKNFVLSMPVCNRNHVLNSYD